MEKHILIVLAGQLRTWYDVAPTVQRMIDAHVDAGCLVDVLMVYPTQSRRYDCGNGIVYDYTGVDIGATISNCTVHVREQDETIIEKFYETNLGTTDLYWLVGHRPTEYPDYLPVINYWYYRAVVAVEKDLLEMERDRLYDTVLLSRFDLAFMWKNPEIEVPNIPPGVILDRRQVDLYERFSTCQIENRYFPDGDVSGTITMFRNDLIEQVSSCTTSMYNGSFLNTLNPMLNPNVFGTLPHHQLPVFIPNSGMFTYEDYTRRPNSLISQSSNDSSVRGMSAAINYIVLRSVTSVTYEHVYETLERLGVFAISQTDASKFIYRKIILGCENAVEITRKLPVKVIASKPMNDIEELGRSMFDPNEGPYLDFKPIVLFDLDTNSLDGFTDRHGCFDQPFRKTLVSKLYE